MTIKKEPRMTIKQDLLWPTPLYHTVLHDFKIHPTKINFNEDLIGYAKIRSKKDDTIKDCGLENYCIYPSGMIKYYLRFRSFDGTFGYSFRRWSTSKDLLEINLKKEFDFCNK